MLTQYKYYKNRSELLQDPEKKKNISWAVTTIDIEMNVTPIFRIVVIKYDGWLLIRLKCTYVNQILMI